LKRQIGAKMASKINTTTIDTDFPVPGVNNSTQTFRDNWTAIVNNLNVASSEITDLINKAVVTAPLTDGANVVVNNLNSTSVNGGVFSNMSLGIVVHPTITTSGTENFDFSLGPVHTVVLNGADARTVVNVENYPDFGYSELQLHVTVTDSSHVLDFSSLNAFVGTTPAGLDITKTLRFSGLGIYKVVLGTDDGSNWFMTMQATAKARSYTPPTSVGVSGDTAGQIAYDSSYVYICTMDYNGSSPIWKRSAFAAW
jgi:hypothetical protein